jgi:hypothetical protein
MRHCAVLLLAVLLIPTGSSLDKQARSVSADAASMERKLRHVESNGASSHPDPTPTEFTEKEVNAYFAAGKMQLPRGVKSVRFQSEPGVVRATAHVDFEQVKAGVSFYNPLLSVFSGIHDVVVVARAHGAGGEGFVQVDSVSLDGLDIPRFVLQLFVEKYIQPKYPGIGLNSRFALPDRIDRVVVGQHKLTVTQK